MKEQIYTVPVNEAYEKDCECPFCFLQKNLEAEAVEYATGAAMMEPDFRILSNEKGYCGKHYGLMLKGENKLSLALVLDTRLKEVRKQFSGLSKEVYRDKKEKGGLFKKASLQDSPKVAEEVLKLGSSCVICERIEKTLTRYIYVFFHLWKNDEKFKDKVEKSKGVCLYHFGLLCGAAYEHLPRSGADEFIRFLYEKELAELERIQSDIDRFILKFDYRNKDMEWGTAQDAPLRTIEKMAGYMSDF